MKALYSLVLASGTKEALFAALWLALGEEPGKLEDATFADVVKTAERFGVSLTESQARKRVKELEKLDVLAVVPKRERGRFDLLVFQPAPTKVANEPKPEPATPLFDAAFGKGVESFAKPSVATNPTASVPVFDAVSETEAETAAAPETVESIRDRARDRARLRPLQCVEPESVQTPEFSTCATPTFASETTKNRVGTPNRFAIDRDRSPLAESESRETDAASLEEINNKYIKNKTINKPAKIFKDETQAEPEARSVADVRSSADGESPKVAESRRNIADVRALVDFEAPKVAAFRRLVARSVWERTVHPDLIDRIVALAVLRVGGTDAKAVESMIRDAKAEVALWNRTDGRRGQPQIWRALTPEVKRVFENAGWVWAPTRFATEPRPKPRRVAETVDA